MGWHPGMDRVARAITIGAGLTSVCNHRWRYRWKARVFRSPPVPALAGGSGYLPGRMMGIGADLPRGVRADWRRWCSGHIPPFRRRNAVLWPSILD